MGCAVARVRGLTGILFAMVLSAALTAGPAWASSPGGNGRIAFASTRDGGGIFTVRPDGTALRRLTTGDDSQPAWSPDGRWLAFTHRSSGTERSGIYLVRSDGQRLRFLVAGDGASWSPNGGRLIYTGEDTQGSDALAIIRRDGTGAHFLGVAGTDPSWSPRGGVVAFVARTPETGVRDIYLLRLADRKVTNLTHNRNDPDAELFENASAPDWSPDGAKIAFSQDDGPVSECFDRLAIHTIRADGTGEAVRGNIVTSFLAFSPAWAPAGGGRIVFGSRLETEALPECGGVFQDDLVMSRPDGATTDITSWSMLDERDPAWRPIPRAAS
jgi:Tol biopolymer transport system component